MQAPNTTAILHTTNRSHPESRCPPLPSSVRPMPACIGSVHLSICHNHDEVVRARDKLPGRKQRIKMERRQREQSQGGYHQYPNIGSSRQVVKCCCCVGHQMTQIRQELVLCGLMKCHNGQCSLDKCDHL